MVVSGSISRAVSHELSLEIDDFGDDFGEPSETQTSWSLGDLEIFEGSMYI